MTDIPAAPWSWHRVAGAGREPHQPQSEALPGLEDLPAPAGAPAWALLAADGQVVLGAAGWTGAEVTRGSPARSPT